jgi:DNA repair photolyase
MRPEYREEPCRSAVNRVSGMMFGWSLNPYMGCVHRCTFCYVRAFERRADRPADDRYGQSIRVKVNVVEVLRRQLSRPSWKGEMVAIGTATDPYQPAEGHYRLTRGCLEALSEAANPLSLITRGPLVVRDIDVLAEASRRARVSVTFSIPTLDPDIWRTTEPSTAPPAQRLRALSRLADAGIDVGVGMAPMLPGLSDRPELIADVVKAARDAGARSIWTNVLNLRPGTREHFLENLARDWPELVPRYEALFRGRDYLPKDVSEPIRREVAELRDRFEIGKAHSGPQRPSRVAPIEPRPPAGTPIVHAPTRRRPARAARSSRDARSREGGEQLELEASLGAR